MLLVACGRAANLPNAHQAKTNECDSEPRGMYRCYNCNTHRENLFFSGFACHGMVVVWGPLSSRIGKTYECYNCNTHKNENNDLEGQRVAGYRTEI